MEILNLALKNFKGHEDEFFEFSRGTNAICGENGAGKTSIFEAIAWVLFDHCDYQKKELIRTGAGSASAVVEFLSSLDGRCYRIKRNTQRGYELFDPQLNEKLPVKKREDVQKWLREHLGVPRNTELSRLFAETIGIPQGTFTADFLKRPGDRKKIFDPILKVEDYKQTYANTRDLETYAKAQVTQLQQKIDLATVQLADWDSLKSEFKTLSAEIEADKAAIATLSAKVKRQQTAFEAMQALAQNIESLEQQYLESERDQVRQVSEFSQTIQSLEQAKAAAQICKANQKAYRQYTQTQQTLTKLQEKRQQYQTLQTQAQTLSQSITQVKVQQSVLASKLEGFAQLESQIQALQPFIPQQDQLECQRQDLQQQIQALQISQGQIQPLVQQIQHLEAQQQKLSAAIQANQGIEAQLSELPALEQARQQVMKSMGHWEVSQDWLAKLQPIFIKGKIDRDRHRVAVQTALKQLDAFASDAFGEIEAALKEGAILNTGLLKSMHQLLTELDEAASPERLNQKLQEISLKIQTLQQVQTQLSRLDVMQQQWQEGDRRKAELQNQLAVIQTSILKLPDYLAQQAELDVALESLGNPKSQVMLLQRQLQEQDRLTEQLQQLSDRMTQLVAQQTQLDQDLAQFQSIDQAVNQAQAELTQSQAGYQRYLQHQTSAAQVEPLTALLKDLEEQQSQLQAQQAALKQKKEALEVSFDLNALQQLQIQVQSHQIQMGQLSGGLAPKEQRSTQIQSQLSQRQELFEQCERDRELLAQKQEIADFIQEARRIYNQSGPRISELYQREISYEADRLFRELLHRQDVALRWTEDYDIQVQDDGHWRTFKSLSGGEQMCASLAVRLALLKTLADINVAFFDEPTTNMDALRRSQLAEAIANLKSFHQLFVISHDDTFEAITESIIRLKPKAS